MDEADKFQYLLQSLKPGIRARELVESDPLTTGNYPKAVLALEQRFDRKDLLIEVYVRELLKLIIVNVREIGRENLPLSDLFVKVGAHLRSLESMGMESDKNARGFIQWGCPVCQRTPVCPVRKYILFFHERG